MIQKTNFLTNAFTCLVVFITIAATTACQGTTDNTGQVTDLVQFCAERKGFNLLGKFDVSWSNQGFVEKEFRLIHELGFNFVRLPLDYRTYTKAGDWNQFIESEVHEIDLAVEWGIEYNVHVCINLHRATGFCVNATTLPVNQQLDLWTDTVAQNAFIRHWEYFANRYKDVPPAQLSFNLVNEPAGVTEELYVPLARRAIKAIHDISPDRIVFVDGLEYGRVILPVLKDEPCTAQAIHCYDPFGLTHYRAEWVDGADGWRVPHWPMLWVSNYLYGPWKSEYKSPLVIEGTFPPGMEVTVNVRQVSVESTLRIQADKQVILSKRFVCGADTGADFSQVVNTQWGYQNISNKDFTAVTAAASSRLTFENIAGDWMTINSITLKWDSLETSFFPSDETWGQKQATYLMDEEGNLKAADGSDLMPFGTYRDNFAIAREDSIPIMVQEFGVYNKTPHDVTIGFLSDLVQFFNENQSGWALWNFSGSFGILNSDRSDCTYEYFQGYQLDRQMLDILTRNDNTGVTVPDSPQALVTFPSPAKDYLSIATHGFSGVVCVDIFDVSGRLMKSFRTVPDGSETLQLDVSDIRSGMYLVALVNKGFRYTGKIIIHE
jgi:aryl-phospho-beta-D-glucosidase BglC (GH1 family)